MAGKDSLLDPRDVARVVEGYRRRIAEQGVTFESLCSGSTEKQRIRHQVHATSLCGDRPEVLDIGCGLADFYRFLLAQGRPCDYTGCDIVTEYVEACQRRHAEARFEIRNVFEDGIDGTYDTIVMSQVLNNRYQHSDEPLAKPLAGGA